MARCNLEAEEEVKKNSRVIVFPLKCQQKNGRAHQSAARRLRREGVP
jgi:hypothetical protein